MSKTSKRPRIVLGITGSIAAVKGPRLALLLSRNLKSHVKVVLTRTVEQSFWKESGVTQSYDEGAWKEFWDVVGSCKDILMDRDDEEDWRLTDGSICVHYAEEEWNHYENLSSPVLHIQLRAWADLLLIAPLSAHTLAKIANGLCDDLLSCIARAWDFGQRECSNGKPVVLCPAMNTAMWDHVLTRRQLDIVKDFGKVATNGTDCSVVTVVEPMVKKLACGDVGAGALAELDDILQCVKRCFCLDPPSLNGNLRNTSSHSSNTSNTQQQTLIQRKVSMKKALLRYSRETFSAMQSTHEQSQNQQISLAAPISPTPNDVITLFLPHLNLGPDSLLIDLGCGDGRWLVTASKLTKCKCLGIDVDEQRIRLATQSIDKEGLTAQIQVRNQDVFEFLERDCLHFPIADVLIIYLFRDAMKRIGPSLKLRASDMKSGMKILCVGFGLPDWKASHTEKIHGIALYLYEY